MHLEAIDVDLWYVVKNSVPKAGEGVTAADVKRFMLEICPRGNNKKGIIIFPCS